MTTILNASNGATSGLIATGDNSGVLQLQTNNGTPALTLNATQALGVGSSPSYGTSGQVLTSGGTSASPTWTTPSSGAMSLISTQTANNTSPSFTWSSLGTTYTNYLLVVTGILTATTNTQLLVQIGEGSSPTWISSNYNTMNMWIHGTGATTTQAYYSNNGFIFGDTNGPSSSGSGVSGTFYFFNIPANSASSNYLSVSGTGVTQYTGTTAGSMSLWECSGNYLSDTTPKTAIRLITNGGSVNLLSGTASLYGISS